VFDCDADAWEERELEAACEALGACDTIFTLLLWPADGCSQVLPLLPAAWWVAGGHSAVGGVKGRGGASPCAVSISLAAHQKASKWAAMLAVLMFAHAPGSYGRWRGPWQALAVVEAVKDWGSWPRNGLPNCPANLGAPCRLLHTAAGSGSVGDGGSAHVAAGVLLRFAEAGLGGEEDSRLKLSLPKSPQ
jgi:hypothetical protein